MSSPSLRQVVADALEVPVEQLTPEASSETIEAWDSLKHLDVILAVESATQVKFATAEIPELTSLARIERALVAHGWNR